MFNFDFGDLGGGGGHSHGGGGGRRAAKKEVDTLKFYALLGVEKTASEADIKKAFRRQAMTHHPDRGGNAETFKDLNKAYEVLSDSQKRAIYDEGGEEALADGGGGGGGPGGMDIFDLFGGAFGGGGRRAQRTRKGEDVVFPLQVTLEDLYNGVAKKLRLTKNVICSDCRGKGGKDGAESKCTDCRGQGVRMVIRQIGPGMIQQMQAQCATCKGSGSNIAEKDKCKSCHGEKTIKEKKTLEIHISKGMKHGEKLTFSGEADEAVRGTSWTHTRAPSYDAPTSILSSIPRCMRHFVNHRWTPLLCEAHDSSVSISRL
jgi:DnaJ family protein A protein 2